MEVKLTPAERQLLINQYAILEKLDPENAEDYKEHQEILQKGLAILYDSVVTVWEETDIDEGDYVVSVLNMHSHLKSSFEALSDKEGLTDEDIEYSGFDGNNESKRYSLASFFAKQGKWAELNLNKNSHSIITMHKYPAMVARWKETVHRNQGRPLSAKDIKYILDFEEEH